MATVPQQKRRQSNKLVHYAGRPLPILGEERPLDVVVNADESVWVNRLGRGFAFEGQFSTAKSKLLLNSIARVRQIQHDHDHPILETIFPLTGGRIEGLIWPVVLSGIFAHPDAAEQTSSADRDSSVCRRCTRRDVSPAVLERSKQQQDRSWHPRQFGVLLWEPDWPRERECLVEDLASLAANAESE